MKFSIEIPLRIAIMLYKLFGTSEFTCKVRLSASWNAIPNDAHTFLDLTVVTNDNPSQGE